MTKFTALIQDIDKKFYSSVYNAAKLAAQEVVSELQQYGPSWSGKFSNSWEIREGNTRISGGGTPGEPRALIFPGMPKSISKLGINDVITFAITNLSPYKAIAMDKEEATFYRPTDAPTTALGRSKWERINEGRIALSKRGQVGGSSGTSSRTADLDWYTTYINSGRIERIIKTKLSSAVIKSL